MKQISRVDGSVRISLPDTAGTVSDTLARGPGSRRGRRSSSGALSELDIMLDALTEAASLSSHSIEVLDRFNVDVGDASDAPSQSNRRGSAQRESTDKQQLQIELDLAEDESAVMLIEQDGTYEWHYPFSQKTKPAQRTSRGSSTGQTPAKLLVFRIPIGEGGRLPRPSGGTRAHRGPITGFIKGKIQGLVLKFIARKTIGMLTPRLERGVTAGPVHINSNSDVEAWVHQSPYPLDSLPTNRAARVLLFVHGTFSSTVGSFGTLTTFAEGQQLLEQALMNYDLVIGFDHYTLSETPEQNAEQLLDALLPLIKQGQALEIDAISFSRGGLVYRYFSEVLLPDVQTDIRCRKAIFVGCTNNGTELAKDANWKHLIDFYTNMIAGAARLLEMLPVATVPSKILRQGVKVIGSFVTYIAQEGVANNGVPGIASMEPEGDFIRALNTRPEPTRLPAAASYYAIGSDFEPANDDDAFKLGKSLVLKVADGFVDKLMSKRANDLVVNVDSMFMVDPAPAARLMETRSVNANGRIYHTVYFHQPLVANLCGQWLDILKADSPVRLARSGHRPHSVSSDSPRRWWNDAVADDFLLLPFTMSVKHVRQRIKAESARLLVLQRLHQSDMLYYAVVVDDWRFTIDTCTDPSLTIGLVMGLHEWQSRTLQLDDALQADSAIALRTIDVGGTAAGDTSTDSLTVVLDSDKPVGIVLPAPLTSEPPPAVSPAPATGLESGGASLESADIPGRSPSSPSPAIDTNTSPSTVWCHMHTMMPEEVNVKSVATLEVILSRDLIIRESGVSGAGQVDPARTLIIQVLPRKHCDIVGNDRVEVSVPDAGNEVPLWFDIKALAAGVAEIDIVARQGNLAIMNLKLRPKFIKPSATPSTRNLAVNAQLQPATPRQELSDVLRIYEVQIGDKLAFEFQLDSGKLGKYWRARSEPFKNDLIRQDYIRDLYNDIEKFWADDQLDYDAFLEELMARGARLFDELLPEEVQSALWKHRNTIEAVQVFSDDPFIPWELLYLKQPGKPAKPGNGFLVEKGMFRWLSKTGETRHAPTTLRLRGTAFRHVIPRYPSQSGHALPGAQDEKKLLESIFSAKAISASSRAVKKALSSPDSFDILHFACHGLADSDSILNASLLMKGDLDNGDYKEDRLSMEWLSQFADLHSESSSGPLIFLNACQTGRQGYSLTGTGGFAQAFLESGAGAFIGAHWSIGDRPALKFSETLYESLLDDGDAMIDAVRRARDAARNNKEVTWLAYTVYADPFARVIKE